MQMGRLIIDDDSLVSYLVVSLGKTLSALIMTNVYEYSLTMTSTFSAMINGNIGSTTITAIIVTVGIVGFVVTITISN